MVENTGEEAAQAGRTLKATYCTSSKSSELQIPMVFREVEGWEIRIEREIPARAST